ncbi:MAG: Hsp20/alpha crystallin family protein [bacterium]|jgi:HSP20 family protein|nr:Hsp20/alpha crystallin family protein [bacterium]
MARQGRKPKDSLLIQEDFFGKSKNVFEFQYFETPDHLAGWNPSMDIFETEKKIYILIEAAGLQEETVNLHSVDNRLVVSGERTLDIPEAILHYHQLEIQFMPFQKTIILPGMIDADKVEATYRNGMLYICVAKRHLK